MINTKKIIIVACVFFALDISVQAQICGFVMDSVSLHPLSGVHVIDSRNNKKTITDNKGFFEINVQAPTAITYSCVGYKSKYVLINTDDTAKIYLSPGIQLNGITIFAYESKRSRMKTPGAISVLTAEEIELSDKTSFVPVLNSVPGVKMEERAIGSYRISIRGSSLRSPFDVRNIKVYLNNFPFTEPSGITPIKLLDIADVSKIEVIRGPSGSTYGAGLGGVLLLNTINKTEPDNISYNYTFGSFGLQKHVLKSLYRYNNSLVSTTYSDQSCDGYRDNNKLDRKYLRLYYQNQPTTGEKYSATILYSNIYYEIPGGLNYTDFKLNPKLSRAGSIEQKASVKRKDFNVGLSYEKSFNRNLEASVSIYSMNSIFDNPYIFNYEKKRSYGLGGRSVLTYRGNLFDKIPFKLDCGGEVQYSYAIAQSFENISGEIDSLWYEDEITIKQSLLFIKGDFDLSGSWILSLGISKNNLNYDIFRVQDNITNSRYHVNRDFNSVYSPRISLLRNIGERIAVHGNIGYGFSPPTIEEIRTGEGSINQNLGAEKGINYEVGYKYSSVNNRLQVDANLFYFRLYDGIISYTDTFSTVLFRNAGKMNNKSLEVQLSYKIVDRPEQQLSLVKFQSSFTHSKYIFDFYSKEGTDFSGNNVPGCPANVLWAGLNIKLKPGFYAHFTNNFVDKIYLNDANSASSSSYILSNLKLGFEKTLKERLKFHIYMGINNLYDQECNLGYDINAFGERYYQPSLPRHYYWGAEIRLKI